jgi:apolipoprotein N-acyltransferase
MIATRQKAKPIERNILTSTRTVAFVVSVASAVALTAAFPKLDWSWIAPLAMAGLFWSWFVTPAPTAVLIGLLSGIVYFAIMCSWFATTAAGLVGPFGFLTVLGPAVIECPAFALAAGAASLAYARVPGIAAPFAAAAAFGLFEWLRSVGTMGMPFAQVGYSQVQSGFAPLAAYGGTIFVTFIVAAIGALIAWVALDRSRVVAAAIGVACIALATFGANLAWPARHAGAATIPVAAIQGNIRQAVKWDPQSFVLANRRYVAMTREVSPLHPQFVLWPETVVTAPLGDLPQLAPKDAAATQTWRDTFASLARDSATTIAIGSLQLSADGLHNSLYFFSPLGTLEETYRKRQLVPYAEWVPYGSWLLRWFPYADQLGRQVPGRDPAVVRAGSLVVAPLICWESAFSDVVQDQIVRGATLLAVATDDGWFGESAGPYQHAQIAQMRAIETGRWVLRAAATGISGIIAPTGAWTERAGLDEQRAVTGFVGPPAPTFFSRIGPWPVAYVLAAFYLIAMIAVPRILSGAQRSRMGRDDKW